jgi:hypothetical protein
MPLGISYCVLSYIIFSFNFVFYGVPDSYRDGLVFVNY